MLFKLLINALTVFFFFCIALVFIFFPLVATADTEVGVFLASQHYDGQEYNETNPGLYVIHNRLTAGTFQNSYYDQAYMLGYTVRANEYFSLGYGLVYGYGWNGGYADADRYGVKLLPYIMPTLSYTVDNFKVNLHYIGIATGLSISYELN